MSYDKENNLYGLSFGSNEQEHTFYLDHSAMEFLRYLIKIRINEVIANGL
ncbi:hypothetical protein ES703_89483 [subsurface metagenome]